MSICPVCCRTFHEAFDAGDGDLGWRFVDHVPCAQKLWEQQEALAKENERLGRVLRHASEVLQLLVEEDEEEETP